MSDSPHSRDTEQDEAQLREWFSEEAPAQEGAPPPNHDLVQRVMQQARLEIAAKDWIDFATQLLVLQFFLPILEMIMGTLHPAPYKGRDESHGEDLVADSSSETTTDSNRNATQRGSDDD